MKNSSPPSSSPYNINSKKVKVDRKTVERNRRIEMKDLCFQLTSLIPPHHFKPSAELLSQQDQLDQAATYIKQLKERVDELRVKKEVVAALISMNGNCSTGIITSNNNNNDDNNNNDNNNNNNNNIKDDDLTPNVGSVKRVVPAPVVELREFGSSLEVVLISSGSQNNFMLLYQVIVVLQEEGTDVLSLSFSTVGDRVFHTLHTQVKFSRVGVDASRIRQRLQELMHSTSFSQDI